MLEITSPSLNTVEHCRDYYNACFFSLLEAGCSDVEAIESCAHRYLDGKPIIKGLSSFGRSEAFWGCDFWKNVSAVCFQGDVVTLALGRAMYYDNVDHCILDRLLLLAPEVLKRGIRNSQLFLRPASRLWQRILLCSSTSIDDFKTFLQACNFLREELKVHDSLVEKLQGQLVNLTVLETLIYGSLFAFQHLVPARLAAMETGNLITNQEQEVWMALNSLLAWKLKTRPESDFHLTERLLAESLKRHMAPIIFPGTGSSTICQHNLELFADLVGAQIKRNDLWATAITSFSFDDDFRYRFDGGHFTLYPIEFPTETDWDRNGRKLQALHTYWFNRAIDQYILLNFHERPSGKPENENFNRIAHIDAIQIFLQLVDVYGLEESLESSNGVHVDLFSALHSLGLMTAFFNSDFITPFKKFYESSKNWQLALAQLAMAGLLNGMQNRFPLTWAESGEKAKKIKSWTASDKYPRGNLREAEAILAFWTSDLKSLASNLKNNPNQLIPEFHERPFLKLGSFLFQLPWITALQNNSTAAINNLRRIGSRRGSRIKETHRIEQCLGEQFESVGFAVISGYQPMKIGGEDPGEIDLLCFMDGHLFLFEIKSTFVRKTQQEAWIHRTTTLRKAAHQLGRKKVAILSELKDNEVLRDKLCLKNENSVVESHCWIVDTSIEYDQSIIDGFLKVSLEGLLIILRNDQHLLKNQFLLGVESPGKQHGSLNPHGDNQIETENLESYDLFPGGFSAGRFAEIVERGELWRFLDKQTDITNEINTREVV